MRVLRPLSIGGFVTMSLLLMDRSLPAAEDVKPSTVVVTAPAAGPQEQLAAREVQRYVYCRTSELLPVSPALLDGEDAIVVANKDRAVIATLAGGTALKTAVAGLGPQQYMLKTLSRAGRRVLLVVGGDGVGTLYGAYRLAEHLGVRFFLHGDVIPDKQVAWKMPELDEIGKPLFELRGLNPWGSHPFGFDLWNADDYQAHLAQMAKMRMNFIGMHCYPEGHPYAEPTVWVGEDGDFDRGGRVTFSYPSSYYNALFRTAWGKLRPGPTGDYHFGGAMLFDRDGWGPEVMRGYSPRPETPEACNEVFNRTGEMFRHAFAFARLLGVKTCLGTESPVVLPKAVQERLESQGSDPNDPAVVQQVYEGMFRRIMAAHPLDYFWLWTPEGWTWRGNTGDQMQATIDDMRLALAALKKVDAPFRLATCGWVLGPKDDRAGFDKLVPDKIALSAISRHLGEDPIDPAFGRAARRDKWAIPWMEGDNGGLAVPQLWVGRTRQDAVDARAYGCNGLMGLIWRTRILGPNIATLAQAGWEQPCSNQATKPEEPSSPAATLIEGAQGGKFANYPGAQITGTDDDVLYQTCRYDLRGYDLKVPNGRYRVTLKFCEPHFHSAGKRVCDLTLQGKTVLERLDIFAEVGHFAALDQAFDDVEVSDERLKIEFSYVESLPCVSGIVVEGKDYVRKINCGGPAHTDYAADFPLPQSAAPSQRLRKVPCEDFYNDWATALFGSEGAGEIAAIFARIDSRLPRPLSRGCPAGLRPDRRLWQQVVPEYAFVGELEKCRDQVTGAGNRERFDYWLGTMQYLRAGAKLDCAVGKFQVVMEKVKAEKDAAARKQLAAETALPAYREILAAYRDGFEHLLATVSTNGGLATVMFWEQSIFPSALGDTAQELSQVLGAPLPPDMTPSAEYTGDLRIIVPTVRTCAAAGESLHLRVILLSSEPPSDVALYHRPLGAKDVFRKLPLNHVARAVYTVSLPPLADDRGLEYYIQATVANHQVARFPATAPEMSQTVVALPQRR